MGRAAAAAPGRHTAGTGIAAPAGRSRTAPDQITVCSFARAYVNTALRHAAGIVAPWPMGNSLTVERAALTRLVLVRIQVPQPVFIPAPIEHQIER